MIHPATVQLRAYRGVPFSDTTDFVGQNYADASFRMEIRAYRDAPGDPLVLLEGASAGAQGISVALTTNDGIPTSSITIRINETTIEALQMSNPRGGEVTLQYALDVTGGGLGKHRRMQGPFVVEASANG